MNRLLVAFLCAILSAPSVFAASARDQVTAVMNRYLQLDGNADRVSDKNWADVKPVVTWLTPVSWNTVIVITDYRLTRVNVGSTRAQAIVVYTNIGELSDRFTPEKRIETVTYHLNKVGKDWKVDGPVLKPHVLYSVMEQRLAGNPLLEQLKAAQH